LNDFLKEIKEAKEKTNKILKENPEKATIDYQDILEQIEEVLKNQTEGNYDLKAKDDILAQRIFIMSNKAIAYKTMKKYRECIDMDQSITIFDPNFDKAYGRLIECYTKLGEFEKAKYYAGILKFNFPKEIHDKYKSILDELDHSANLKVYYYIY
jgi:hypothetical protein